MENQKDEQAIQKQEQKITAFDFFNPVQFETMQRICKMFSSSELVPEMYRTNTALKNNVQINPESRAMANCMIAIEIAQRIGASPLMIMQNMYIIYGRPSWSSKFLIATINTCGRFNPLQFKIENNGVVGKIIITEYEKKWIDGKNGGKGYYQNDAKKVEFDGTKIENLTCVAYTSARGSENVLKSTAVDVKLAIQEGWYTKAGSKWPTMTPQMLMYRTASFWANTYAPELSMGMKTVEEIIDTVDIEYEDVTGKENRDISGVENKEPLPTKSDKKTEEKPPIQEPEIPQTPEPVAEKKQDAEKMPEDEKPLTKAQQAMQSINPNPGF